MLILLSPAKTLDFETTPHTRFSQPRLLGQTEKLVNIMRKKSANELKSLMKISDSIAELNVDRFHSYSDEHRLGVNAKQALMAFKGDVYRDWSWRDYSDEDFGFAQSHVRILSGLYGLLRPLDLMQPYRLEMGTKLKNSHGKNLYEFWGTQITELLKSDLAAVKAEVVVNLASNEYYHSVQAAELPVPVVSPRFLDYKNGKYKIISFYAKTARGAMADWLVRSRATTQEDILNFDGLGYRHDTEHSAGNQPTFIREP